MQEIQQALTTTSAAPAGAALVPGADPDPNRGALRETRMLFLTSLVMQ